MADNYLEKKMEELHSRKAGYAPTRVSSGSRHLLTFPFKPLRVLVIARGRHAMSQYIKPFQNVGCRVALITTIDAARTDLIQDHGCRYYATDNIDDVASAFNDLIRSWRDIDVVIMLDNWPVMTALLRDHAAALPYPNDWGCPILTVSQNCVTRHDISTSVEISDPVHDTSDRPEASALTFLSLKSSASISSISF